MKKSFITSGSGPLGSPRAHLDLFENKISPNLGLGGITVQEQN